MPQATTRKPRTPSLAVAGLPTEGAGATSALDLIRMMLEYEGALKKCGADAVPSRFSMVTTSEREFLRAELIADYIRLSIGNLGNTAGYFDAALADFCAKICDMVVPSLELVGTYLASVEIVSTTRRLSRIPNFEQAVRRTMIQVLRGCVNLLESRRQSLSCKT